MLTISMRHWFPLYELDRAIESLPSFGWSFLVLPLPLRAVVVTGTVTASVPTALRIRFGRVMDHHRSRFRTSFEISYRVDATVEDPVRGVNE
jgi:hypothetical protein